MVSNQPNDRSASNVHNRIDEVLPTLHRQFPPLKQVLEGQRVTGISYCGYQDSFNNMMQLGASHHSWEISLAQGGIVFLVDVKDESSPFGQVNAALRLHTEVDMALRERWMYHFNGVDTVEIHSPNGGRERVQLDQQCTLITLREQICRAMPHPTPIITRIFE